MKENIYHYYENYSEDTRLIKDKTHQVEFDTTVNILDKMINASSSILDVGAGTGRYSFYLAEKGHQVYALEYTPHNLQIIESKLKGFTASENITAAQGDGRDLSRFEDNCFDAVLCMGPIYHLSNQTDRAKCVSECVRVLRPGGILAVAYINKFASFLYQFKTDKSLIQVEEGKRLLEEGCFYGDQRDNFYFTSPQDMESLVKGYPVEIVTNAGTDGIGYMLKDIVDHMNETEYQLWLQHHMMLCEQPSLLGYSLHGLLLCRKK